MSLTRFSLQLGQNHLNHSAESWTPDPPRGGGRARRKSCWRRALTREFLCHRAAAIVTACLIDRVRRTTGRNRRRIHRSLLASRVKGVPARGAGLGLRELLLLGVLRDASRVLEEQRNLLSFADGR